MAEKAVKKTAAVPAKRVTKAAATGAAKAPAKRTVTKRAVAAKAPVAAAPAPAKAVAKRVIRKHAVSVPKASATSPSTFRKSRRKTKVGYVVSAKQALTVIVEVERMRQHPLYKKAIRVRKKFAAHDASGEVRAGDLVRIQESRPFSATKRWMVVEVLSRAGEAGAAAPKVADIEAQLEASEGSKDMLVHAAAPQPDSTEEAKQ